MKILITALAALLLSACSSDFDKVSAKAEQGDARAQYKLGLMYTFGDNVTQDDREAVKWYSKAAEQGDIDAQHNLGVTYYNGDGAGVTRDFSRAYMWFSIAASNGHPEAAKVRDLSAKKLTQLQIAQAHGMARKWMATYQ